MRWEAISIHQLMKPTNRQRLKNLIMSVNLPLPQKLSVTFSSSNFVAKNNIMGEITWCYNMKGNKMLHPCILEHSEQ
jgi:hypothetical protein